MMVHINIDLPKKLSRYLDIQKIALNVQNKQEAIIEILNEKMVKDSKLTKILKEKSTEV